MPTSTASKPNGKGVIRIFRASINAFSGVKACWINESAFRQEVMLCLALYPVIFFIDATYSDKALLFLSLTLVAIVELINSAIESAVDRIGIEHHELSGRAKDMGAAAVMLTILMTVGVWLCVIFN
ncbi:MAG TPA: diacylglycerol kinase [Halomonas sp.]|uniref:diacylglycerol kinase n=1 Tax=Vreelandella aquamarina TaxID=77097 RepID=UPI000ED98D59|nr:MULTISPECIES: diacylglycerol kinase [Halomonas]MCD2089217.1 diacylglycerol kinase [Halomonas meridiana]HAO02059.1 diacylglycerol kinase [Halomonas sp.]